MTDPREISIRTEPRGDAYRELVDTLADHAAQFLLVVRDQIALSPAGREILDELKPFRRRIERSASWPGTQLIGHSAEVSYFECSPTTAAVLKRSAPELYSWQQPDRPEDLCFLDEDGAVLLGTVAHEADAWVQGGAVGRAVQRALGDAFIAAEDGDA